MLYRVAKETGEWDVSGLSDRMTWSQLAGWLAYYQQEPFGEEREDMRMAISTSAIVNILISANSGKKKPKLTKPGDFMNYLGDGQPRERKPISESQWQYAKRMAKALAGSDKGVN